MPLSACDFLIFHRILQNITFSFEIMEKFSIFIRTPKDMEVSWRHVRHGVWKLRYHSFWHDHFGYYNGTQNTQIIRYVRHLKWGRLERGHFELLGIRQQVLTITNITKKSALPNSFRKYLALRSYLLFPRIYLQI